MVRLESQLGLIEVEQDYFDEIIGSAVKGCFGVARIGGKRRVTGLQRNRFQGVRLYRDGKGLSVDVRVLINNGLNIAAVVRSIHNRVGYAVEEATGLEVRKVNVFVDGILHKEHA